MRDRELCDRIKGEENPRQLFDSVAITDDGDKLEA